MRSWTPYVVYSNVVRVLAAIVPPLAAATVLAADPPKIEFIAVEGRACLQPRVNDASADLADYRAAESRWLATNYPGVQAPTAETVIELSPVDDNGRRPDVHTIKSETFHLEGIDGPGAVVCFDVNLTKSSTATYD